MVLAVTLFVRSFLGCKLLNSTFLSCNDFVSFSFLFSFFFIKDQTASFQSKCYVWVFISSIHCVIAIGFDY